MLGVYNYTQQITVTGSLANFKDEYYYPRTETLIIFCYFNFQQRYFYFYQFGDIFSEKQILNSDSVPQLTLEMIKLSFLILHTHRY